MAREYLAGICLLVLLQHVVLTYGAKHEEVLTRLFREYDRTVRPNSGENSKPTEVEINFYVRDLFVVDRNMQYIGAQLTFRQKWNDPRLSYPENQLGYLATKDTTKLWVPDIFFSNSKDGRFNHIMEPNVLVRIYPNGDVLYSRRVTLDLKCRTNKRLFPLNKMLCPIIVASYGFTTKDIHFNWKEEDPVQYRKDLDLASRRVYLQDTDDCSSRTTTGEYSCLKSNFIIEPNYGSAFCELYLPPLLLVLLGWLTFFLQERRVKVRLSLLLTIVVLGFVCCVISSSKDPDQLNLTGSDFWSGLCLAFTGYALLHFVMINHVPCLTRACGYTTKEGDNTKDANDVSLQPILGQEEKGLNKLQATSARFRHLMSKSGNRADIVARMLYPTVFIVANIIYWALYNDAQHY